MRRSEDERLSHSSRYISRGSLYSCAMALLLLQSPWARGDDQDVIDYRVHIMKTMEQQVLAMNQMLQKKVLMK